MSPTDAEGRCGVVIIGRNEGERLLRCIDSARAEAALVVYVDSGSTDGSAAAAVARGAELVALDLSSAFTAARARNAGFARLRERSPMLRWVQFVDGDCELRLGWLAAAQAFLETQGEAAVVCGRLRERHPERSLYNRLCDMEWNVEAGRSRSCGGIAMFRSGALAAVGGFREDLIAGEEPELCLRLRGQGWQVWRLDQEMAWHDAAMSRFGQWWRRAVRGGHAYAEGASLHGRPPERHGVAEVRRALLWAIALPLATLLLALWTPWAWLLLLAYPLQVLRLARRGGWAEPAQRWRALFLVIARFAEAQGVLRFHWHRLFDRHAALIEYK